jgi:membrane protein
MDSGGQSWLRRLFVNQLQLWTVVVRGFVNDGCILRASALTFTTLLSLVPLLALMFSVLKGLGVQNEIEGWVLKQFAVANGAVVAKIVEYINNTNVTRLGSFGLVFLVMTVLTLLSNIEKSFNQVWGVKETRPLFRRFTDYFSVVTIGPVFVALAISMTGTAKSHKLLEVVFQQHYLGEALLTLFEILPFIVMWLVFAGLYLFMPNIKVSLRAALVGGVFGGTLWQISQWGYLNFQVGVARYNAIYGTMAALPILMVWIYLSWMIVLLGLEVAYAIQNLRSIRQEYLGANTDLIRFEFLALAVLVSISRNFYDGVPAPTQGVLINRLEIPSRPLRNILEKLVNLGFITEVMNQEESPAFMPAKPLEKMNLNDVLENLSEPCSHTEHLKVTPENNLVREVEKRLLDAKNQALDGLTLRDLMEKMKIEGGTL